MINTVDRLHQKNKKETKTKGENLAEKTLQKALTVKTIWLLMLPSLAMARLQLEGV